MDVLFVPDAAHLHTFIVVYEWLLFTMGHTQLVDFQD
jgi:hypothetical protein